MKRELPARPSLEHLKAQAKDLLEAARHGEAAAQERFRQGLPAARGASAAKLAKLALHDAQSLIAREYGFASWSELKSAVEAAAGPGLPPEQLRALLERVANTPPRAEVMEALQRATAAPPRAELAAVALPAELPVVPLRDTLLTVGAVAPIRIGRASSAAALNAAQSSSRLLALFGQKNALEEAPGQAGLHAVGCLAWLHERLADDSSSWLIVRALQWIRLAQLHGDGPYLRARVEAFAVREQASDETRQLEQQLRERVRAYIGTLPDPGPLRQLTERMSALQLADATVANSRGSVAAKADYAAQAELAGRLRHAVALLDQP